MVKLLKISGRVIGFIFEWFLILLILFAFFIRTSFVQTYLAQQATLFLSKELKAEIKVGKVSIVFFNRVALDNVLIKDRQNDTLASIHTIYATLDKLDLKNQCLELDHAEMEKGTIHIYRSKENGTYNYSFLEDYFSSRKSKKGQKPFSLFTESIQLNDIHFRYDDFRKEPIHSGMDYNHIDLKNLYLSVNHFSSKEGVFRGFINELRTKEKCGFILKQFQADVEVSSKGVKLDMLMIETKNSKIKLPWLYLLTNDYTAFLEFEDRVIFDAKLSNSSVSLKDISFFAPHLRGMDQMIKVSALVRNSVKNLSIQKLHLKTGKKSSLRGSIKLPDFRNLDRESINENIEFAHISITDLKTLNLPNYLKNKHLNFGSYIERLKYVQLKNLNFNGTIDRFSLQSDIINTQIGSIKIYNRFQFVKNPTTNLYSFHQNDESTNYGFSLVNVHLNQLLVNSDFGVIDGSFHISGEFSLDSNIRVDHFDGKIDRFSYLGYTYREIKLMDGNFTNQNLSAKINIKDEHLNLSCEGSFDFKENQHLLLDADITKASLNKLYLVRTDSTNINTKLSIDIRGSSPNNIYGNIDLMNVFFEQGTKSILIPNIAIAAKRNFDEDNFTINSKLASIQLSGKIDFNTIYHDISNQILKVFPSIAELRQQKYSFSESGNKFKYSIEAQELNELLELFMPDFFVASGTLLKGSYDGRSERFNLELKSPLLSYQKLKLWGIDFNQDINTKKMSASYKIKHFMFNDSTSLDDIFFESNGENNQLDSRISWNQNQQNQSLISWNTLLINSNSIHFTLNPSFLNINNQRWDIKKESHFNLKNNRFSISDFKIQRDKQYLLLDGSFSDRNEDQLRFQINEIDLSELGDFFGLSYQLKGKMNGWGYVATPFQQLNFLGDATIQDFYFNNREIGDIYIQSEFDKHSNSMQIAGNLLYRGNQTFDFDGRYFLSGKDNKLDIKMTFDHTDIAFIDLFIDPEVLNSIQGELDGTLNVTGTLYKPDLDGKIELLNGQTKVETLGVTLSVSGLIKIEESGIFIDNMPVIDEEGNAGSLIASVYHTNFKNWNYDLQIDLEPQISENFPFYSAARNAPLNKFLVLNTAYKESEYYYGKAYATGTANIFGYDEHVEISLDFETQKGTQIFLPMYGVGELREEESFLVFKKKNQLKTEELAKNNYNELTLDLNFRVNQEAKVNIIFNEQTEDEIEATGSGNIAINIDNTGDLKMDGVYRVKSGNYNFTLGPIKKLFYLVEGGSIIWTGDPENATMDIKTYHSVRANLKELSAEQFQNSSNTINQDVLCYLSLTESLLKPTISFDIKAPKADESGKALVSRVTSDKDELNRQFFSLLLWKRFQPLKGGTSASSSAATDLAANQINSVLDKVSKDYKMNVNLNADEVTGDRAMEFNLSKRFFEDRLIVTGSFGIENNNNANQYNKNGLIGDVNLEYLLTESGNVRVNIFNESNDYTVVQSKGLFTQGFGIHYSEDFDQFAQFKLAQSVFDVFRKNKRFPNKRKKKQTPVPLSDSLSVNLTPLNDKNRIKKQREQN